MRAALALLLLLAGCASGDGSARGRVDGVYTTFGTGALHR